jgi:CHAT domain-containing protein
MLAATLNGDDAIDGREILDGAVRGPRVVVLGSCESSVGPIVDAEGLLGPASLFLASGAGAVVASSVPIDDRSTPLLLDVHARLAAGTDPATALFEAQRAQLARVATDAPVKAWAGFAAFGGISRTGVETGGMSQ